MELVNQLAVRFDDRLAIGALAQAEHLQGFLSIHPARGGSAVAACRVGLFGAVLFEISVQQLQGFGVVPRAVRA